MNMLLNLESPVTTAHRAKLAYIYVRQSTAGQVRQHQESTELQYRLVDRAALFGWPKVRIEVIDDDLGKSGTSSDSRGGFQRLIAEIGLGKAGLVLSLDASRLARNNHDWHQLLELCSLFGVLIADGERVYDPCAYHDRLLLGLSGIMSEAELHQIKLRLHQGERQKAARGELRVPLPAGLAYGRDGRIGFNPDEEVHARLLHLFAKSPELRSAKAVMRHFQEANFLVPVRPLDGPSPHDTCRRAPRRQDADPEHFHRLLRRTGQRRGGKDRDRREAYGSTLHSIISLAGTVTVPVTLLATTGCRRHQKHRIAASPSAPAPWRSRRRGKPPSPSALPIRFIACHVAQHP